jgi:hypothetical protein
VMVHCLTCGTVVGVLDHLGLWQIVLNIAHKLGVRT